MMGYKNAALCALAYLKAIDVPADESSFARVAASIGDSSPAQLADGFIVVTTEDFDDLCEIGGFSVVAINGVIVAKTLDEMTEGG